MKYPKWLLFVFIPLFAVLLYFLGRFSFWLVKIVFFIALGYCAYLIVKVAAAPSAGKKKEEGEDFFREEEDTDQEY